MECHQGTVQLIVCEMKRKSIIIHEMRSNANHNTERVKSEKWDSKDFVGKHDSFFHSNIGNSYIQLSACMHTILDTSVLQ